MKPDSKNLASADRRGVPLWGQVLIWIGFLALLSFVGMGLFRAQHPVLTVGSSVSDFSLRLFDGYRYNDADQISLSGLRGKVVVVNFWASWCVTCADEAPFVQTAWEAYQADGQVVFLGVDYTDVESKALDYLSAFGITYPNGPDLGTRIAPIFNRNIALPETYIIARDGILRVIKIGPFQSVEEIQSAIDPLLIEE